MLRKAANKISSFFFMNNKKTPENLPILKRREGMRLPVFAFSSKILSRVPHKSKLFSFSKTFNHSHSVEEAGRCCAKQDFYLYPYKMIFLQKNRPFRKIVGWKFSHNRKMLHLIQGKAFNLQNSHSKLLKKISILNLKEEEDQKEKWESFTSPKEERHFRITRITDYHI